MTAKFDPYHKWLAIPASERPIHYLVRTLAFRDGDLVECELEYWRDDGPEGAKWRLTKLIVDNEVLHESP